MADDQAGGLHCRNCGHEQQMGWDDPESWMEGKFDWDFNLPLEGMAQGDELLEPGERNWVIPTRNFGPRHHGSTRSLYHGTLLDHLPSIQQHGLLPEVGPFVSDAYDLNPVDARDWEPMNEDETMDQWIERNTRNRDPDYISPEAMGVEPAVFMTDKKRLEKSLNAIRFNIARKLNKPFHQVSPLDVRNHGLLLKHKGEMGAQDPPMNYVYDESHEEPFEEGPRAHQPSQVAGEGPYQAEPGDYYSTDPVGGLEPIHGPAMMRVFERHGLIPWWDPLKPEEGMMPDAAKEVYGAWRFAMPVTPQYWKQRPKDFALYHGTSPKHLESIMQHGLHPWDSKIGPGTNYAETPRGGPSWLTPRPGHVYLSQNPRDAHDRGINAEIGGLPPGTNVEEYLNKPIVFKVDPRKLSPQHINPDEDFMLSGGGKVNNQEEHPEYESLGEMAERFGWGDVPSDTERVLGQGKSIGYRGVIPPEALTPGRYRNGEWTPLEEHTASWHFEAGINPRKLITTAQDHERGKKRWGFPKPRALGNAFRFKRAAVDPDWLQKWMEVNGPYMTHQTDSEATRQKIEQEGLIPHDQGPGSQYDGTLVPRANHAYLARNLKALSAYSRLGEGALKNSTVAVDLRKLDPTRINADEDAFDQNAPFREGDKPGLRGQLPRDVPWPRETRENEPGFPGVHGVVDTEGNRFPNMGEWADRTNVTAPHHTAWSMNAMGHAAIEGGVHPEAIVPVDAARQDLEQNWPQVPLPDSYGPSHKVVPIEQPRELERAANLIGEMRDGWGRFASGAPWEWGQWGKGIYYPETGTLQTWGDDRTHPEVALEDENATQGSGHHFVIRPNGTVKDQGAMDMNFESVEGDVPGLAQALREFDPRLRLDKPSDWDFGSTEPVEEEPSAISRGEKGGTTNDVQTGNDYAGSL